MRSIVTRSNPSVHFKISFLRSYNYDVDGCQGGASGWFAAYVSIISKGHRLITCEYCAGGARGCVCASNFDRSSLLGIITLLDK